MSVSKVLGAALAATLLVSSQALALTITNRDADARTVVIQKGDAESEYALPAGESMEEACEEGCVLRLADVDGDHQAGAEDRFVIQNGSLQREEQ
jgi:hypothetical protein